MGVLPFLPSLPLDPLLRKPRTEDPTASQVQCILTLVSSGARTDTPAGSGCGGGLEGSFGSFLLSLVLVEALLR